MLVDGVFRLTSSRTGLEQTEGRMPGVKRKEGRARRHFIAKNLRATLHPSNPSETSKSGMDRDRGPAKAEAGDYALVSPQKNFL